MAYQCPDCGANHTGDNTCQSLFDEFLVLEFTDPGYGAVHLLTVACFMIQHGRYSDPGLAWIERQLYAYLEEGIPVSQIRRQANIEADQNNRNWKVVRQPDEPPLPEILWSMTIADVAAGYRDAASYREWITRWARATWQDMQPLVRRS